MTISEGPFSGQKMDIGGGEEQIVLWVPDKDDPDVGFCFDFNARYLDHCIALLTKLKAAHAVPVELHSVQPDDRTTDSPDPAV
jgi:hypothetical protein